MLADWTVVLSAGFLVVHTTACPFPSYLLLPLMLKNSDEASGPMTARDAVSQMS